MKKARRVSLGDSPLAPEALGFPLQPLEITVIFTGPAATLSALMWAHQCAQTLNAHIVLVCQVVPRYFDFTKSPISTTFMERQLCSMAAAWCPDVAVEIRIVLCRHLDQCLKRIFDRESVVILGGRKRWWHSREQRLAKTLESSGHRVLFVDSGRANRIPCAEANGAGATQRLHVH